MKEKPLLDIEGLSLSWKRHACRTGLLQGVDLYIAPGETLGLTGQVGAGKSLLALAISGFTPEDAVLTAYQFHFMGHDLKAVGTLEHRRILAQHTGLIFQNPQRAFNPSLSIGRHMMELSRIRKGLSRAEARSFSLSVLSEVGFEEPERIFHAKAHELSGGMCQRAMLALALLPEPALLIADEPSSALDRKAKGDLLHLLRELTGKRGAGLLLISHDRELLSRSCDRVMLLSEGRLRPYVQEPVSGLENGREKGNPGGKKLSEAFLSNPMWKKDFVSLVPPALEKAKEVVHVEEARLTCGSGAQKKVILEGITLKILSGDSLGLWGSTGAGKSSFLQSLCGLVTCDSGTIRINGRYPERPYTPRKEHGVGFLFQDCRRALHPLRRVGRQLEDTLPCLPSREKQPLMETLLERLGLAPALLLRYPHQLSGGQCQLLCLARILQGRPSLLLLDEPTAALDAQARSRFVELLRDLQKMQAVTIILASHDFSLLEELCTRYAMVEGGRILEGKSPFQKGKEV